MKLFTCPIIIATVILSSLSGYGQKIGINTTSPLSPVHMKQATGTTLLDNQPLLLAEYTGVNAANAIAIQGKSKPSPDYGIGGDFEGGFVGVQGKVSSAGANNYYGVFGNANGSGQGVYSGVFGAAQGTGTNIGLFGFANGGTKNWAGYFATGDVHVQNRMAIGTTNPSAPFHATQGNALILFDKPVALIEYTGNANYDVIGLQINNGAHPGFGIAARLYGSKIGLESYVLGNSTVDKFAVLAIASGTGDKNYGIYASAEGGQNDNYAGYFNHGNVYMNQYLGIGDESPVADISIKKSTASIFMQSESSAYGPVLLLRNTTSNPIDLGRIVFSPGGSNTAGSIQFTSANEMVFNINYQARMKINANGLVGLGRDAVTNRLEVEGNASKSSAGDWLANSDARLKDNIQPLNGEAMMEKLNALQGVTYEWNDDKTGTARPEGIQYGFTAQNIQDVFPTLVEEDNNGYLQTAYGTYDPMMVEAIKFLYEENMLLKKRIEALEQSR